MSAGKRPLRLYRVEETITVVGIAYVEASSKAEAEAIVRLNGAEFVYNDGQDLRRGDGIRARLARTKASS